MSDSLAFQPVVTNIIGPSINPSPTPQQLETAQVWVEAPVPMVQPMAPVTGPSTVPPPIPAFAPTNVFAPSGGTQYAGAMMPGGGDGQYGPSITVPYDPQLWGLLSADGTVMNFQTGSVGYIQPPAAVSSLGDWGNVLLNAGVIGGSLMSTIPLFPYLVATGTALNIANNPTSWQNVFTDMANYSGYTQSLEAQAMPNWGVGGSQ